MYMSAAIRGIKWFYHEFGVDAIYQAGRNAYLLMMARSCRMFAYGTNSLILAIFFSALGFTDHQIGLFMTLTLLGDVLLGTLLTLVADRVGRRRVLLAGSGLMVFSGIAFALAENFWALLFAAIVGVISISGGDFGPFRSIEESILSQITTPSTRADVLSWYVTTSTLASSIGSEVSGQVLSYLLETKGWKPVDAYHSLFWIYAVMGLFNALLVLLLTRDCELSGAATGETYSRLPQSEDDAASPRNHERHGNGIARHGSRSGRGGADGRGGAGKKGNWLSWRLSSSTRSVMYKLWFLLAIDSMADGMVPASMTNYFMDIKFHPAKSTLGGVSSVCYFLGAVSSAFAAPLARKIGLVNTMVYTHMPSSTAVLLFPLPPPSAYWAAVTLLIIRVGLNNLDQAPRAAFIAAVVRPDERTAVMGVTSTLRTLSAMTGPIITGILAADNQFWIAFVAAGLCRLSYDIGLWAMFANVKPHQYEGGREGIKGHGHSHASSSRRNRDEEESLEMARIEITPPSIYADGGSEAGDDNDGRDGEDEDDNDSGEESEVEQAGPAPATASKASGSAALRLLTTFGRDDNVNSRSPLTPRTPRHTRPPGL